MYVNLVSIQTMGIGLAAFLSFLILVFVFLSARQKPLGKAMCLMLATTVVWSWFGFLYEIVPDVGFARNLRVVSVMGIVWISMASINFALIYLEERVKLRQLAKKTLFQLILIGIPITIILLGDLFGLRNVVGALSGPASEVLAPNAGPLMVIVVSYYSISVLVLGLLLALRARAGGDKVDRRQAEFIFLSLTLGLVCGGTRFAPWYGFDFQPIVAAFAAPLFAVAVFYSIRKYKLLNLKVAIAQILVFILWTFTFFRALLEPSIREASPDIGLFIAVLILGIFLLRSVTTEIRTERELSKLTLEHVKTEFVILAAHQLHTPLNDIQLALGQLIKKGQEGKLSAEQRGLISDGNRAANKLLYVVNDLIDVARISSGTLDLAMEVGDARDALRASSILFQGSATSKNVALSFDVQNEPLPVKFDRGKLAIAIENLIDNAIKYTRPGGSVLVSALHNNNKAFIKITDTGIGISRDDQERLFEKFFRGEEAMRMSPNDSGLGLFVAKNIVDEHGGTLTIESIQGKGTVAAVSLPIYHKPAT